MTKKLKIGIVGTSWWADWMFLPSLKSHPRVEIAAICGRNRDRAEEMARKYGITQVFTDDQQMISNGKLHALVVAVPDELHYPITMRALDAGLHVLCEKPLANSADQAKEMYERAEAVGVKHMVLFTWRWMPYFQYLHQLLEGGYIGRCYNVKFSFLGGYGRDGEYAWRFDSQRANGILGDLGSHMIDFARWYVGDIVKVHANLATFVKRPGVKGRALDPANDSALLTVEFANGSHGMIETSAVAHTGDRGVEQHLIFYGEKGTLQADVLFSGVESSAILRGARHDENQFRTLPIPDDLWGGVEHANLESAMQSVFLKQSIGPRLFVDSILNQAPVTPNFYDGFKVQQVVDAALRSHRTGCQVSL